MAADEIVISGMSGRFPESDNVEEFKKNLFEGIDMITENPRWPPGLYDVPLRYGKLRDITSCDAIFFGISPKQTHVMDPGLRILFEATYEALVDAGISPQEICGSNTGVFMASSHSDTEIYWLGKPGPESHYFLVGCPRSMLSNQLSYVFDFTGPTMTIDTACSGSATALELAITAIKLGQCDAAVVGASNLVLHPNITAALHKLGMLSPEGKCKTFDEEANGYVRSETVGVIYLQKAKDARRIYATIMGVKVNSDGYKEQDISCPSEQIKLRLYKEVYEQCNISPLQTGYVEVHGTGTPLNDIEEANSVAKYFCKNRNEPLLVGSVKSNMGNAESASTLCSIIKALIAFECGMIPQNLHFNSPNKKILPITEGKLKVVTKNTRLETDFISINSAGLGGTSAHIVLKRHSKQKSALTKSELSNNIPYIIGVSGRSTEAVNQLFDLAEKHKNDQELLTLLNLSHHKFTPGHRYRGYMVLSSKPNKKIVEAIPDKRPIWFIISGMGSQWPGMGKALMEIDVFRNSITNNLTMLRKYNIKIENYLLNVDGESTKSALEMFVAIETIQIAIIDVLKHIGIKPDGLIGHSFGEICCAYADGILTAEEAILCAYYRGLAGEETKLPPGAMAVVGLSAEEVRNICPPTIFVACDNSQDNVTISGPPEDIDKFMTQLSPRNVFIRKIESYNIGYHSEYVSDAAPKLRNYLNQLIKNTKHRSPNWISTSVPESEWATSKSLLSPEFYVNNFVSPVLFRQALKHIPNNAITIEIGATSLFRPVLTKAIGPNSTNISLIKKNHPNNLEFFLSAIGDIYNAGGELRFDAFYPNIEFPVSRGTPMIGPSVQWDRSMKWMTPQYGHEIKLTDAVVEIDISTDSDKYLAGHILDGKIIFPSAGFLKMVWETFAKLKKKSLTNTSVVIEDFEVKKPTVLHKDLKMRFVVNICEAAEQFYITESESIVAKGRIREINDSDTFEDLHKYKKKVEKDQDRILLTKEDVYQTLTVAGYDYSGQFESVIENDLTNLCGKIKWDHNWVTHIDGMMQLLISGSKFRDLCLISSIEKIVIDPIKHLKFLEQQDENTGVPVKINYETQQASAGSIHLTKVSVTIPPKNQQETNNLTIKKYQLVPYDNPDLLSVNEELCSNRILEVMTQIVVENCSSLNISLLELLPNDCPEVLTLDVLNVLDNEPRLSINSTIATTQNLETKLHGSERFRCIQLDPTLEKIENTADLLILNHAVKLDNQVIIDNVKNNIKPGGFLIVAEIRQKSNYNFEDLLGLQSVATQKTNKQIFKLYRKVDQGKDDHIMIQISSNNFDWIKTLNEAKQLSKIEDRKILLYSYGSEPNGLVGLVNTLKLETDGERIRSIFINDPSVKAFYISLYKTHLKKDLIQNVYKNGTWASYRHLALDFTEKNCKVLVNDAHMDILVPGDLSTLTWVEASPYLDVKDNNQVCSVYYSALNYKDVMIASGKMFGEDETEDESSTYHLGFEFSGKLSNGKRVMGIAKRSLARTAIANPVNLWEVPDKWSLKEAATVPVAYAISYYSLFVKADLQKNESVLIHCGAGAVGLAAITLALSLECEVFTTVSNQDKKNFLLKTFPKLKAANIGSSRDSSFKDLISANTNAQGVNVVLNSLSGELMEKSVKCLSKSGRFVEIGRENIIDNSCLQMRELLQNISFITINLDYASNTDGSDYEDVHNLLIKGIESGVVKPLPRVVFEENQVETAFRLLESGKCIGKVLVKVRNDDDEVKPLMAISKTYMNPLHSYIIVGGLSKFGLELANWLTEQGAKKIVLTSQKGIVNGYQNLCMNKWRTAGIEIKICTSDISKESGVKNLIETASSMGNLEGIFNLDVMFADTVHNNQSIKTFEEICKTQIDTVTLLDQISRQMIPNLKYFVVFSLYGCVKENSGQSTYSFVNSTIERVCENRRECGFHGIAIQWGALDNIGETASKTSERILPQRVSSFLKLMHQFLKESAAIVCSMILSDKYTSVKNESVGALSTVARV